MENNNSVCFVAKINEIKAIPGADNIEQAIIGGWSCIVQKNSHSEGELVVVATTDAIIPMDLSEKLGVTSYLRKGGRVRTIKLRGVYSECLIVSAYANFANEGDDMMDKFNIYKYEPPVKQVQLASGRKVRWQDNPNFHVYYKFPNLKNVPGMFTEDDTVEITRKIHGTNARYGIVKKAKLSIWDRLKISLSKKIKPEWKWAGYEFVVGSHNVEKGSDSNGFYDTNVWYEIADKYDIKNKLWNYAKTVESDVIGDGITLYGEIYGAGIQKGYDYGLTEIKFAGFDIKEDGEYLSPLTTRFLLVDMINLPYIEVLYYGQWSQEIQDSFVFNNFIPETKVPEEGIVIKINTGERPKVAKVINPDYLIFAEKHNVEDSH